MEDMFPYWWCAEFGKYGLRVGDYTCEDPPHLEPEDYEAILRGPSAGKVGSEWLLPFDLHFVAACIAPRPLISTNALGDTWANPFGTQINWRAADEVYRFLGAPGKQALVMRDGYHAYQRDDWEAVLAFCDQMFAGGDQHSNTQIRNARSEFGIEAQDWREICLHFDWRKP